MPERFYFFTIRENTKSDSPKNNAGKYEAITACLKDFQSIPEVLRQQYKGARLWINGGSINHLIWTLKSLEKARPLPIIADKGKETDGILGGKKVKVKIIRNGYGFGIA